MTLHVFGIRHHGPGCARSLRAALEALAPDAVLIEGPPDAQEALVYAAHEALVPPVALLVYANDAPQDAVFYPFAEFSPEWQALRYAATSKTPARFIDLPCAISFALDKEAKERAEQRRAAAEADGGGGTTAPDESGEASESIDASSDGEHGAEEKSESENELRIDPLGSLAEAAGFTDRERWWELQVEQRLEAAGLFEGILEAMRALREEHAETDLREQRREAHMRTQIRAAQKEGFQKIAVVCGAWHAPVLETLPPAKRDQEILKGLPKLKTTATWIPWDHSRLSYRSGYGAGVDSPGWYAHVWSHRERAALHWATLAARLLRGEDLDASSANVIETVRLADALASMRGWPTPGLAELREAIGAVLCNGETARLALIRRKLEIGERLGAVPDEVGQVPVARDFEREAKRLRLKQGTEQTVMELDLRKELDRERSQFFHRLGVLELDWAKPARGAQSAGTFRETWQLAWRPELVVALVASNIHGNTVAQAAARLLAERAQTAELERLTALIEVAILTALSEALDALLVQLDARAAISTDVRVQLLALGPLARIVRYSDVRQTRAEHVLPVLHTLFERVLIGLPPASTQLDEAAAAELSRALSEGHAACLLLDDAELKTGWLATLRKLMESEATHARLRGRTCRLLLEQHALGEGELETRASLALGPAIPAETAAQWIEGVVGGEGVLLVHQDELLRALDGWLAALSDEAFQAQLPLLRRAFSSLQPPERRGVAQKIKRAQGPGAKARPAADSLDLDAARASRLGPVLAQLLGARLV